MGCFTEGAIMVWKTPVAIHTHFREQREKRGGKKWMGKRKPVLHSTGEVFGQEKGDAHERREERATKREGVSGKLVFECVNQG